jgi:cytochrome c551/c552
MKRTLRWGATLSLLLATAGCGGATPSNESEGIASSGSPYDDGPRAGESPVAEALAERGRAIFRAKGCTACHAYGQRLTGPDLKGVTRRRTARWMEQQILHPEIMTKQDPIAQALMEEYALRMSNQGLTPEEAAAVIEHLKWLDDSTSVSQVAK